MTANNAPTAKNIAWLVAQVAALQDELAALRQQNRAQQNQQNTVVFADTPQTLEVENSPACRHGRKRKQEEEGQKNKNKKDKSNHVKQKKDKAWKKVPPKDGEKHEKKHDKCTYYWCKHHMAWTMLSPKECRLGQEPKGEEASSATVAAAAATAVNPSYQALLSTLAKFQDEE
jgi:hypothetical protein